MIGKLGDSKIGKFEIGRLFMILKANAYP